MFHDVQQVMAKNNILDHISNQSDGCQTETAPSNGTEEQAQIAPTPSEIARRALANEHDAAIARVNTMQLRLQKFNDKFDNWNKYQDTEYKEYCKWSVEGQVGVSKSEFDVILLREQQGVIRTFVQAEADLEAAISYARSFRVIVNEVEQQSDFVDRSDGY